MSALLLLQRFWREGVIAILLLSVVIITSHYHAALATCRQHNAETQAAFDKSVASYRAATAQAQAADAQHAREVESRNAAISQEAEGALQKQLEAARAAARDYASRLQRQTTSTDQRRGSPADLPSPPNPASDPARTGQDTILDDANACSEAVVKAQGWVAWYKQVSAVKP